MSDIQKLLAKLPDPDNVGSAEYRTIHEFLHELTDADDDELTAREQIDAVLDELEDVIKSIRNLL